jgi:hypothetical protein
MFKKTSLELARAGPVDLRAVSVLLPIPVAPKLLRDRAEDRLGVDGLPLCRYEPAAAINLFIAFFPILGSGGFPTLAPSQGKSHIKRSAAASELTEVELRRRNRKQKSRTLYVFWQSS